jgi:mono/diheme cytochrome c family protein
MNKITNLTKGSTLLKASLICLSFLFFQLNSFSQTEVTNGLDGQKIFKANCAACHSVGANKVVGPGLQGVNDKYSKEWLVSWTKNSADLIASGDADAIAAFEAGNKIPMPPQNLSDEEIQALYAYVADPEGYSAGGAVDAPKVETAAEGGALAEKGKKLFKANCAACHSVGENVVVGPGLAGISEKRTKEWLHKWIKNSADLIASGDADAKAVFEEYKKLPMPAQAVNDEDIDAILAYIASPGTGETAPAEDLSSASVEVVEEDNSLMMYLIGGVIVLLIILVVTLNRAGVFLKIVTAEGEGKKYDGPTTLWGSFKKLCSNNKGVVAAIVIVLFFGGLLDLMDGSFQIGVHQGYKPEQPIKFSHKVHAGDNKIDCNYCHSSARHSKTSGIPSLNVCMNCHSYVDGSSGKTFMYNNQEYSMTEEIQKIYDYLDYDAETKTYGDNPTPVKWVKVHNLPDHVFYSHDQHVTAGKQKCQTCHGPVEEMDVVEQYSSLTMKWCVECHKETSVATEGNGYYDEMHKRMTPEFKEKVMKDGSLTVDEIGGWECAKCHY